ncbi:FUN14 domain-containing protein [Natronorarus salvus]|uniref:FUN14 domain-containing protein n=1 Tax=Natronorarus salvus TaxID=3117733 RepID=UPI002F268B1B
MLEAVDLSRMGLEFGGGSVAGAVAGFAAKQAAKLLAVLVVVQLALFRLLESRGVLSVDWAALSEGVSASLAASDGDAPDWVSTLLSTLSVSAGFTAGFLIGFHRG